MNAQIDVAVTLINDEYAGEPAKRTLAYIQSQREQGKTIVGTYCGYAPLEVIRAMDAVPAVLCAFSNKTIEPAEAVLPANLCPLIKSSYGFIITDTCPFSAVSDAVIGETTCDGKKKMFELIASYRPMFVMDLPQVPDQPEARNNWTEMIKKLAGFLETTFDREILVEKVEREIKETNIKNRMMNRIFAFAALKPPVINWSELYELTYLAQVARGKDFLPLLEEALGRLETRVENGFHYGKVDSPRVLITGCPVGGDANKVFGIIEESGGVIVAVDNCTGMKSFMGEIEEGTDDPFAALSRHYLELPCSCMTPNFRRLSELDKMISWFKPDAVIDVILHACHSYNIEAYKIMTHVKERHDLPYLKIETDYSEGDVEQIRTRVEALLESL